MCALPLVLAACSRPCKPCRPCVVRPARLKVSEELLEVFELADADNNGKISPQELLIALRVLGITTDIGRSEHGSIECFMILYYISMLWSICC